jgi:phosphate/sulfate permease
MLKTFTKYASNFNKNPLSIIALFISLIYGFACLVLGSSNTVLDKQQKWPIVWFIVIFPLIVLIAFLYLVVRHHKKLYGPRDYKEDASFLKSLDIEDQKKRLKQEVELSDENDFNQDLESSSRDTEELQDEKSRNSLVNKPMNKEVKYNQKMLDYFLAEELALRGLEFEFNGSMQRQVGLYIKDTKILALDGLLDRDEFLIGVEVKYVNQEVLRTHTINSIYHIAEKFQLYANIKKKKGVFVIALVWTDKTPNIHKLQYMLNKLEMNAKIVLYNLDELKGKFGF